MRNLCTRLTLPVPQDGCTRRWNNWIPERGLKFGLHIPQLLPHKSLITVIVENHDALRVNCVQMCDACVQYNQPYRQHIQQCNTISRVPNTWTAVIESLPYTFSSAVQSRQSAVQSTMHAAVQHCQLSAQYIQCISAAHSQHAFSSAVQSAVQTAHPTMQYNQPCTIQQP